MGARKKPMSLCLVSSAGASLASVRASRSLRDQQRAAVPRAARRRASLLRALPAKTGTRRSASAATSASLQQASGDGARTAGDMTWRGHAIRFERFAGIKPAKEQVGKTAANDPVVVIVHGFGAPRHHSLRSRLPLSGSAPPSAQASFVPPRPILTSENFSQGTVDSHLTYHCLFNMRPLLRLQAPTRRISPTLRRGSRRALGWTWSALT